MNRYHVRSIASISLLLGVVALGTGCDSSNAPPGPAPAADASAATPDGGASAPDGSATTIFDDRTKALLARADGKTKPIADIHVHFFQPSRPGVAWPTPDNATLFHDSLPMGYQTVAAPLGVLGTGVIEASPWNDDTNWVLSQIQGNDFFPFYVAQLDIGSGDFIANLDKFTTNNPSCVNCGDMIPGLRVYLWSPDAGITLDATQVANLAEVQKRGMTLDIISRRTKNPKAQVNMLASMFPDLRIIIDHLGGALTATPDPQWAADIATVAKNKNVYMKFSSFFDVFNPSPTGDETNPWTAPKTVDMYTAQFDVLFNNFGEDRLVWGSNYPVVGLAGTMAEEIAIAETYLATKSATARDKVMFSNAINFYRRVMPGSTTVDAKTTALLARATGKTKPIFDTHVHIFQVTRPGVEWPTPDNTTIFRDTLPSNYADAIAGLGILATGVIEASPRNEDTNWVLDQIKGNSQFFSYAAQLDVGSHDFIANLDKFTTNSTSCTSMTCGDMVAGLRAFLWSPDAGITLDATQTANLTELQKRGMTLDIISRRTKNPKAQVDMLATKFPKLRIIIDHLGGALGATVDPQWASDIALIAKHPNVYMKFSSFFDVFNPSPTGDETNPWTAPKTMDMYKPHFDVLFDKFGEDRLIFGSNWPVVAMAGTIADEIKIAEDYLATKTPAARDKVMFKNAILFYRRVPPN